ncbi:hypothetical protein [Shewanella polaris]|uniref:hypothetical protein n=1 Tax=Shewanella polaris TaxID=2588449 RepID=UPI00142F04C3|nr:hypothetical protein [Shewanella polaris]
MEKNRPCSRTLRKANKEDHSDKFALRGGVTTPITVSNDFDVEDYTYSHFHCTGPSDAA